MRFIDTISPVARQHRFSKPPNNMSTIAKLPNYAPFAGIVKLFYRVLGKVAAADATNYSEEDWKVLTFQMKKFVKKLGLKAPKGECKYLGKMTEYWYVRLEIGGVSEIMFNDVLKLLRKMEITVIDKTLAASKRPSANMRAVIPTDSTQDGYCQIVSI
jgi:hypothetical protein